LRAVRLKVPVRQLIVLLATLAVASPAAARPAAFNGNVCGLLTANQVTAISGVTAKCKNDAPLPGPGSKQYTGNWAGVTTKSPTLQVTVVKYTDPSVLQLAVHNLKQGLPGGTPKKVTGIGDAAYEAKGASEAGIHVAVGKYIAYISLGEIGKTPSPALIEPVAKDVAAKLS
jgi:hypothetical protein